MLICGKPFAKYIGFILKTAILSFLLIIFSFELKADTGSVRILAYHTFMGDKNIYSYSLEEFKKQCEELLSEGFTFITFTDFKKGQFNGDKNILLTIDDGHRTVYDAYKQVMRPLKIRPLLGIYPAIIGKKDFALTWEQLKEMLDDGCEIASHGFYHNFCDAKAIEKDLKAVETEIVRSKRVLEEKLNITIDTFIYPFGMYSSQTKTMLKDAGYSYAMNIKAGAARIDGSPDYELPRHLMTRSRVANISRLFGQPKKIETSEAEKSGEKLLVSVKAAEPDDMVAKTEKKAAKKTKGNAASSEDTMGRSIKEKVYSLMITIYDANVRFVNGIYAKVADINIKIRGFFSGWKIFES